jgi:hypothetical protein
VHHRDFEFEAASRARLRSHGAKEEWDSAQGTKTLVLPAAVEENLEQALSYDLDRHTPFRPEQLYFDATVVDRNPSAKTIAVDWVAALKTAVDSARRQVEDWGAVVIAVVPGPVSTRGVRATRLNLIPLETRPPSAVWRRWQLWTPAALVAAGALAVLVVPLLQKREYAIALNKQTESAREQAQAGGRVEDRDVHALDRHAHHLRLGVVVPLDREVEPVRPLQPRAGERLGAVRARGPAPAALAVLLQLGVHRGGQAVDDDRAALGPPVGPDRQDHPVAKLRIQVPLEEIGRLHDVHIGVDEAQVVFHGASLLFPQTLS